LFGNKSDSLYYRHENIYSEFHPTTKIMSTSIPCEDNTINECIPTIETGSPSISSSTGVIIQRSITLNDNDDVIPLQNDSLSQQQQQQQQQQPQHAAESIPISRCTTTILHRNENDGTIPTASQTTDPLSISSSRNNECDCAGTTTFSTGDTATVSSGLHDSIEDDSPTATTSETNRTISPNLESSEVQDPATTSSNNCEPDMTILEAHLVSSQLIHNVQSRVIPEQNPMVEEINQVAEEFGNQDITETNPTLGHIHPGMVIFEMDLPVNNGKGRQPIIYTCPVGVLNTGCCYNVFITFRVVVVAAIESFLNPFQKHTVFVL
jgi:hypothetical protein